MSREKILNEISIEKYGVLFNELFDFEKRTHEKTENTQKSVCYLRSN